MKESKYKANIFLNINTKKENINQKENNNINSDSENLIKNINSNKNNLFTHHTKYGNSENFTNDRMMKDENNDDNTNNNKKKSSLIPVKTLKVDNFAENNISIRDIMENALFSRLSEIKVFLLYLGENLRLDLYKKEDKILPRIDYIEFNLLNQKVSISEFRKYGFGIYVFFYYLRSLLVNFGLLFIFALTYMITIFTKYNYYENSDKKNDSSFFDYNILHVISGVQIIRYRVYNGSVIEPFDVFYKEYKFTGAFLLSVAFIVNFCFLLYIFRNYGIYKKDNKIKYDTLILSCNYENEDEQKEKNEDEKNEKNEGGEGTKTKAKLKFMKKMKMIYLQIVLKILRIKKMKLEKSKMKQMKEGAGMKRMKKIQVKMKMKKRKKF